MPTRLPVETPCTRPARTRGVPRDFPSSREAVQTLDRLRSVRKEENKCKSLERVRAPVRPGKSVGKPPPSRIGSGPCTTPPFDFLVLTLHLLLSFPWAPLHTGSYEHAGRMKATSHCADDFCRFLSWPQQGRLAEPECAAARSKGRQTYIGNPCCAQPRTQARQTYRSSDTVGIACIIGKATGRIRGDLSGSGLSCPLDACPLPVHSLCSHAVS